MENATPLNTGFQSLDVATGGFLPGELILIGGRPAMGKTALAIDLVLNQTDGKNFVFLQLENNQYDTSNRISKKAAQLEAEVTVTVNDLAPQYSEIDIGISNHVMVHMEKPTMLEIFEVLTPILAKREIDGIVIDSFEFIRPYALALENSDVEKKNLRYLKIMAQVYQKPLFLFSGIHRRVEKGGNYELALGMHGSRAPVVDYSLMLFRWVYYWIEEDMNEETVGEDDAELIIAKRLREVRDDHPRLQFDYRASRFASGTSEWFEHLQPNG